MPPGSRRMRQPGCAALLDGSGGDDGADGARVWRGGEASCGSSPRRRGCPRLASAACTRWLSRRFPTRSKPHGGRRSVNAVMTAAHRPIERHLAVLEQTGRSRAEYGMQTVGQQVADLSARDGRSLSVRPVQLMRASYLAWPTLQTPSAESLAGRHPVPDSTPMIRLREVPLGRERVCPGVLRGRISRWRTDGPPTRPADQLSGLPAE